MIIISACLAGINCRYDGDNKGRVDLIELVESGKAIAVCPEELGGLSTPRPPSERLGNKVLSIEGKDVSVPFYRGAQIAFDIALKEAGGKKSIEKAILKSCSPMCGKGMIYDGTFSGQKVPGNGVFCDLLLEQGIEVEERD